MARPAMSDISQNLVEREMNKHQRGLVDTCFEEGHYEQGIASIDKLRLPYVKPSPAHIRQLIYIALFPPPPAPPPAETSNSRKLKRTNSIMNSPSKLAGAQRDKQQKAAIYPSPAASAAAVRVLSNFADCNTPASLLRALPCYPLASHELECIEDGELPKGVGGTIASEDFREDDDSFIAKAASELKQCKDCWEILKADVVVRPDAAQASTVANIDWSSRNRRSSRRSSGMDTEEDEERDDESNALICERAWPLLEWFIRLWEREEKLMEEHQRGRWSPSLFSHIKPPRAGMGARTEIDTPLAVVFECYRSASPKRQRLGNRLMSLLINICIFPKLAHINFLTATVSRLQSLTNPIPSPSSSSLPISTFLSSLPRHGPALSFKLCICDSLLTRLLPGLITTSRPTARRARPIAASDELTTPHKSSSGSGAAEPSTVAKLGPWTAPTTTRVLTVLDTARKFGLGLSLVQRTVLLHYLDAFGIYQVRRGDRDELWRQALDERTGKVRESIDICFGGGEEEVKVMREMAMVLYEGWCA